MEHVHGVAAGSLFVLALFFLSAVPVAAWLVFQGQEGSGALIYPLLFGFMLIAGFREARCWHSHLSSAS